MRSVTVVGAPPTGPSTVRALRTEGRHGHTIAVVRGERHEGGPDDRSFTGVHRREGCDVAVPAMNRAKPFNRLRRTLTPAAVAAA